jgi:hypothetical protein
LPNFSNTNIQKVNKPNFSTTFFVSPYNNLNHEKHELTIDSDNIGKHSVFSNTAYIRIDNIVRKVTNLCPVNSCIHAFLCLYNTDNKIKDFIDKNQEPFCLFLNVVKFSNDNLEERNKKWVNKLYELIPKYFKLNDAKTVYDLTGDPNNILNILFDSLKV